MNKLILVEGLPGTGKTTISNWILMLLKSQEKQVELLLEDNENIPSNFCNIAGVPVDLNLNELQTTYIARTENYIYIDLSKCTKDTANQLKPWDIGDEYNKSLLLKDYVRCTLELWQSWVNNYENDSVLILDSAFMQNPINEMIFRGATDFEIEEYINAISKLLQPLNPVCVYLRRKSAIESINFAKAIKGENWAKSLDSALIRLNCPDLFERRYKLEFSLLSLMKHIVCDVNDSDWTKAKSNIQDYFEN